MQQLHQERIQESVLLLGLDAVVAKVPEGLDHSEYGELACGLEEPHRFQKRDQGAGPPNPSTTVDVNHVLVADVAQANLDNLFHPLQFLVVGLLHVWPSHPLTLI